eukprot:scaffold18161_cov56-Attheya_sp.AAC.11
MYPNTIIHPWTSLTACLFGKQISRTTPGRRITHVRDETGHLCSDQFTPGQKYSGCIFVDHASGYVHNEFQAQMNTHQTLKSKEAFKAHCRDVRVIQVEYLTDNGSAFTSSGFADKLSSFSQIVRFAGTCTHHHNALAERTIGTIMAISRTMLMHGAIYWPDVIESSLWPMAVSHAIFIWNRMPDPTNGLSPIDVFTHSRYEHRRFHDLHIWGCPMHVLDKLLSDGTSIPRWKPCSQRMAYMGTSPRHAAHSPMALNLENGAIRQQWNVIFDDWFATVTSTSLPDFNSPAWAELFVDSIFLSPYDEDTDEQPETPPPRLASEDARQEAVVNAIERLHPPPTAPSRATSNCSSSFQPDYSASRETSVTTPSLAPEPQAPLQRETTPRVVESPREAAIPPLISSPPVIRTSSRRRRTAQYPRNEQAMVMRVHDEHAYVVIDVSDSDGDSDGEDETFAFYTFLMDSAHTIQVYATRAVRTDPDTLTYEQAMANMEERGQWQIAAQNEITPLVENHTWEEVPLTSAHTKVLPVTWVFRRKRTADGTITIKKYKGRLCVRGDLGTEEHNAGETDTHAPVAALPTAFGELGFIPCTHDPCLLLKKGILVVVYCDDCGGIGCKNPDDAEQLIQNLTDKGFNLTREGTFTEFLGIKFEKDKDSSTITLTQKELTDKTLAAANMTDCNPNYIPLSTNALGLDPDGTPMTETWNYRSIVGMLQYLAGNTGPDISYTVSQVARFSNAPMKSHATAIKTIL